MTTPARFACVRYYNTIGWPAEGRLYGDRRVYVQRLEDRAAIGIQVRQPVRTVEIVPGLTVARPEDAARMTVDDYRLTPALLNDRVRWCFEWLDASDHALALDMALWRANAE